MEALERLRDNCTTARDLAIIDMLASTGMRVGEITLSTTAIDKGMPIEQVQQLLGHQKIDTTMHYAMVKQQNVKLAHRKFIG